MFAKEITVMSFENYFPLWNNLNTCLLYTSTSAMAPVPSCQCPHVYVVITSFTYRLSAQCYTKESGKFFNFLFR